MERFDPDVASTGRNVNVSRKDYQHKSTALDLVCLDKMFADKMLCDVTLVAEQVEIPAHKLILAASSTYFYWKFTNDRKLGLIKRIEIQGMTFETLSSIIAYIYKTEILITETNVWNLLRAALMFALRDLQKACQEFLLANLSVSNCASTEIIARQTNCRELECIAGNYIDAHFSDVIRDDAFLTMTYDNFLRLISRDTLCAREEDILSCVFNWINFDLENRRAHVYALMKYVRFTLIPQKHILEKFEKENWLKLDLRYHSFLVDILRVHILNVPQELLSEYRHSSKLLVAVGVANGTQMSLELYDYHKNIWFGWPATLDIRSELFPKMVIYGSAVYYIDDSKLKSIDFTNPQTLKCSELTKPLQNRKYTSLAVLNNHIYAVGGFWNDRYLASVEMFDPTSKCWKMVANMSQVRRSIGLCVYDGRLFAVGGLISDNVECNTVEYYKDDTNSWSTLPKMSICRSSCGLAVFGKELYVVGGHGKNSFCSDVEAFDLDKLSWTRKPDLTIPRSGAGVIVIENRLYVFGGYNKDGYLKSVEVFDKSSNTWSLLPGSMHRAKAFVAVGLIERSKIILNSSED